MKTCSLRFRPFQLAALGLVALLCSACVETERASDTPGEGAGAAGGASGALTDPTTGAPLGGSGSFGGSSAFTWNEDMRNITSMQLVKEMRLGWNLGNSLDSTSGGPSVVPDETYWGNPKTTQAMIDAVKAAGFNTVRVPVTWQRHMSGAPDYTVDEAWMARVEEVVGYVLSTGLYAILNTHHEEWVSLMPDADQAAISLQLSKLWTQIANRFKDCNDHLVFEVQNEPRTKDNTEWNGGTAEARKVLNAYNLAAVNAIRATGGNNALRHIMVPTHAATSATNCITELSIPNNDARIIVSLHTYFPNGISFGNGTTTWGSSIEQTQMTAEVDRIANLLPRNGRAAVIGEWGTVNQDNTAARAAHARAYTEAVISRGMAAIWWDNGGTAVGKDGFGILNRRANPPSWSFPEIVQALTEGAAAGSAANP